MDRFFVKKICRLKDSPNRFLWGVYKRSTKELAAECLYFYNRREAASWCKAINERTV